MTPWDDVKGSWSAIAGLSIQQFTDEYIKCIGEKTAGLIFFPWNQFDEKKTFIYLFLREMKSISRKKIIYWKYKSLFFWAWL